MLTDAGWILNGADGIRYKAGVPLTVDLAYYSFRSDLVAMAPLIKAQLEAVGASVTTRLDDTGAYMEGDSDAQGGRPGNATGFDCLLWAQHTLPAGDPNWFLETFFHSQDGPIFGSWTAQNFALLTSTAIDTAAA